MILAPASVPQLCATDRNPPSTPRREEPPYPAACHPLSVDTAGGAIESRKEPRNGMVCPFARCLLAHRRIALRSLPLLAWTLLAASGYSQERSTNTSGGPLTPEQAT